MYERVGDGKVAREGREGKGVNMNKEKCEIGHFQWQIWAHLESVGVGALQVMEDGWNEGVESTKWEKERPGFR